MMRMVALAVMVAGCGSTQPRGSGPGRGPGPSPGTVDAAIAAAPPDAAVVAPPATGSLVLSYHGTSFQGPSMLFVVLHRADGTEYPLQLRPEMYSALQDCSQCPADKPATEHSPMPGGAPPMQYQRGPLARYEGARFTMDVVAECPAGGRCVRKDPIPPGEYTLTLGHKLSCPGVVKVPLVSDTELACSR